MSQQPQLKEDPSMKNTEMHKQDPSVMLAGLIQMSEMTLTESNINSFKKSKIADLVKSILSDTTINQIKAVQEQTDVIKTQIKAVHEQTDVIKSQMEASKQQSNNQLLIMIAIAMMLAYFIFVGTKKTN